MGFDMGKDVFVVGFDTNRKIALGRRISAWRSFRRSDVCRPLSTWKRASPSAEQTAAHGRHLAIQLFRLCVQWQT